MRTVVQWREPAPVRGALSRADPAHPEVWEGRLRSDRARAARNQTPQLAAITDLVEKRSRAMGALALILSGSTARGRRTHVSDLDYHVVGARPEVRELPEDIDLYSDEPETFMEKLRSGDDFVHWSVWYGCVLFDTGVVGQAAAYVAENDAWPDANRKLLQARTALEFAMQMVESGDYDRALEEVRVALSLTARWLLLGRGIFPLARDELSDQLLDCSEPELAVVLRETIRQRPDLSKLASAIQTATDLVTSRD